VTPERHADLRSRLKLGLVRTGRAQLYELRWYDPLMTQPTISVAAAPTKAAVMAAARLYNAPFEDFT